MLSMLESEGMNNRIKIGEGNFKNVYLSKNGKYVIKVFKTNLLDCLSKKAEKNLLKEKQDYIKIKNFFEEEGLGYVIPRTKYLHGPKGHPLVGQELINIGSEVDSNNLQRIDFDELKKIIICVQKYKKIHNVIIDLFGKGGLENYRNNGQFYSLENLIINDNRKISLIDYGIYNSMLKKVLEYNYYGLMVEMKMLNLDKIS